MLTLTLKERVDAYNNSRWGKKFEDSQLECKTGRWITGYWNIGNNYQNKSILYGAFPRGYLERIMAMFPDCPEERILHLFAGSLAKGKYTRFDLMKDKIRNPDIQGDAHNLSKYIKKGRFWLVIAGPPYTGEDADHYGTLMVKRDTVLKQAHNILPVGGMVVWLDQMLPQYSNEWTKRVGGIGLERSTHHRVRSTFIFQKI